MTNKERLLTAALLELAAERFSNHVCNDLPKEIEKLLTRKEWDVLAKEYHEWNGDPDEYYPGINISYDWLWMDYMAEKLKKESQ